MDHLTSQNEKLPMSLYNHKDRNISWQNFIKKDDLKYSRYKDFKHYKQLDSDWCNKLEDLKDHLIDLDYNPDIHMPGLETEDEIREYVVEIVNLLDEVCNESKERLEIVEGFIEEKYKRKYGVSAGEERERKK